MRKSNFRVHWSRVGGVFVIGLLAGGGTVACMAMYDAQDIPVCTDKIADTKGICQGEPVESYEDYSETDSELLPTPTPSATESSTVPGLPPCATEDSDNCYWDAASMGNGKGRSFVTVNGETTYLGEEPAPAGDKSAGADQNPQWEGPNGLEDWPYTTGETLVCGQGAKPAIDHREDAIGWWAYCEPALVDQ